MVSSRTVANEFIRLAREKGETLTPMQLLKLVYIAHGWMLAVHHRPLITDEVQAWQYGPVIPRLYNAVRRYKGNAVTEAIHDPNGEPLDPAEARMISEVFRIYGSLSGPALSRITHASGSPWAMTYAPGKFGVVIPDDLIEDHFARLSRERRR